MRSAHSPERLAVELQSRLGPSLSQRGYRVVGQGVTGVTWRREVSGKLIAGLVVLGFLALGGIASADAGTIVFGIVCAAVGVALFYFRRPATLMVNLTRVADGTEISLSGGPDAVKAEAIVRTVAGPEPQSPRGPVPPGSLWSPPRAS